jgi:hypothetical protein
MSRQKKSTFATAAQKISRQKKTFATAAQKISRQKNK